MRNRSFGFTIVELLIVIVVIAILAAITTVAYGEIRNRAEASTIADQLTKISKAFRLGAIDDSRQTWWAETDFTGFSGPSFQAISDSSNTSVGRYLKQSDRYASWFYDNDIDEVPSPNCFATEARGVNVFVNNISSASIAQKVDAIIDDGNTSCGTVRYNAGSSRIVYRISDLQAVQ